MLRASACAHAGRFVGVRHPVALSLKVAATLNNLAELYTTQGRYAEAEPLYTLPGDQGKGPRSRPSRGGHEPEQPGRTS